MSSLGDLAIYGAQSFCSLYLIETLSILDSAAQLSVNTAEYQNDPETLDYLEQLQINIIETYTTITNAVKDSNGQE